MIEGLKCCFSYNYMYIYFLSVFSDLDDFSIFSFEPRLIPKFPLVIPVHRQSRVKVFPPDGKPVPSYR